MLFEGEPQDAEASQQQLFATLLELSCCTVVLPLGCVSMLGAERMQRLSLALAAAAGEAGALQLWEPFSAVAQPFVAEGMQLAKEMQLQLQACGAVGLQQLSEDAEACSAAMQLLQPIRQLGTAVADMQSGSMAVPSGSGPQFSAAALSLRMTADCSEMHAALASDRAEHLLRAPQNILCHDHRKKLARFLWAAQMCADGRWYVDALYDFSTKKNPVCKERGIGRVYANVTLGTLPVDVRSYIVTDGIDMDVANSHLTCLLHACKEAGLEQ
jgi:hypothetical protein